MEQGSLKTKRKILRIQIGDIRLPPLAPEVRNNTGVIAKVQNKSETGPQHINISINTWEKLA